MAKYIGRMNLSYPFAQERLAELGGFWTKVLEAIPAESQPELSLYRFTFASYILETPNLELTRKLLTEAWIKVFGSKEGLAEVLVSEYREEDPASVIRVIYNNYYGVDDYQRVVTELVHTIPLLKQHNATDVIIQQNYLLAIDGGCGFTTLLSSLGDFLLQMNIFKEYGDGVRTKYIEVLLGKETENGQTSQDDCISMLSDAEGEKNPYDIVGIDVSYYLEGKRFDELRQFLTRLQRYQEEFVFVFRIPYLEKKAFDEIYNLFSDMMLIRSIQIPPYADCVLMENVWNILNDKHYVPNTSLIDLVTERIHQEKMDGRFYGYKSVEKIAHEIILRKSADYVAKVSRGEDAETDVIMAADVSGLVKEEKSQATGYAALAEMIGMEEIEQKVREIISQVKISMENDKLERPCIHMRFTGSPGTGKTTVARIIGQIMREEGILRKGGFFEYTGRDLVAEYVGQTAVKTATICRDSYGSVLFIDEAYALYDGEHNTNDFGKEALTTLISEMENHRDDMLIVMAGYTDEMDVLMKANPGLRSRMPRILHFPNYTKEQLFQIFMLMVKKHFSYQEDLEEEAKRYFTELSQEYMDSKEFANARFVRNLYERTWSKAALRCSLAGEKNLILTKEDFLAASGEKEFSEKIERKKVLGF